MSVLYNYIAGVDQAYDQNEHSLDANAGGQAGIDADYDKSILSPQGNSFLSEDVAQDFIGLPLHVSPQELNQS
jgi:hypothetical protein